jgi:hypothetical protein
MTGIFRDAVVVALSIGMWIKLLHKNVSFFVFIAYALLDEFMCFT